MNRLTGIVAGCILCGGAALWGQDEDQASLAKSLRFYASFDESADADFAKGDRRIHTATNLKRESAKPGVHVDAVTIADEGQFGKSLRFARKTEEVVFYHGGENVPYAKDGFDATVSFWMSLDPDRDLEPGYVDPLQITDKTWNNACIFVDFTRDDKPRHFRLGVFSDYSFWNPRDRKWETIPPEERPMVTVARPPFARDRWTHIAITLAGVNNKESGAATLFLDGKEQGSLKGPQQFTWKPEDVVIMLGIYYTGLMDDFAVFDRALTAVEVQALFERDKSLQAIATAAPKPGE